MNLIATIKDILKPQKPQRTGVTRKKCHFVIPSGELAIVQTNGKTRICFPLGTAEQTIECSGKSLVFTFLRTFSVQVQCSNIPFSGGHMGNMSLQLVLGLVTPKQDQAHPMASALSGDLSQALFGQIIGSALEATITGPLAQLAANFEYKPGQGQDQIQAKIIQLFQDSVLKNSLKDIAGIYVAGQIKVTSLGVPALDDYFHTKVKAKEEQKKRELDHEIRSAREQAEFEAALEKKRREHVRDLAALNHEKELENIRSRAEVARQIEKQKIRCEQAKAQKAEAEAEAEQLKLGHLEKEFFKAGAYEEKIDLLERNLHIVTEQLAERKAANLTPDPETRDMLVLSAVWRAHDVQGILIPDIGVCPSLPSGSMVDVQVTTSKDAWVYILLKGSTGTWQCLLPDLADFMGIMRTNRQQAGVPTIWPGVNRDYPSCPFWILDEDPGVERIMVVASEQELNITDHLADARVAMLRDQTAIRGMTNRVRGALPEQASDYHRAATLLAGAYGNGGVNMETVIVHT
ncbi:DUF4384 domain-containing protein [Desulfobacter latus]|uniref:DUF4384 domain-containing protein n=1 Tax=Desulfobacter latus TaxID=2292 RepID=A0A850SXE7_9BACT|nr:DUF4384 domain-containing protein [Desulfobacter latus]NWH04820.1 DUF4384 domain-containing protein [Desulfobacter latus]